MLKLRKEHLDAFEATAIAGFTARVITHVKAVWAAECAELGEAGVAEMVKDAVKRAGALGLSSEFDVVRFVDLDFILAKGFETHPLAGWARATLADRNAPSAVRLERLYKRMEDEFALIEKRKGGKP